MFFIEHSRFFSYVDYILFFWTIYFIFISIILFIFFKTLLFRLSFLIGVNFLLRFFRGSFHFIYLMIEFLILISISLMNFCYQFLDRGFFELLGPYGITNRINQLVCRFFGLSSGFLYHYLGFLLFFLFCVFLILLSII